MLLGPSGTGKTFLTAGLCADAVEKGYKAYLKRWGAFKYIQDKGLDKVGSY